jgi:hypothetical protein
VVNSIAGPFWFSSTTLYPHSTVVNLHHAMPAIVLIHLLCHDREVMCSPVSQAC